MFDQVNICNYIGGLNYQDQSFYLEPIKNTQIPKLHGLHSYLLE